MLTEEQWFNMADSNPHGAGFAFITESGRIAIRKGMNAEEQWKKYVYAIENESANINPMIVHMRWATNGSKTHENAHPFRVRNHQQAFIHNGIIGQLAYDKSTSDSRLLGTRILSALPDGYIHNEAVLELLADYIGAGNKIAILDPSGDYVIINEEAGHWKDGIWFSNSSYLGMSYSATARPKVTKKGSALKKGKRQSKFSFASEHWDEDKLMLEKTYRTPAYYERHIGQVNAK